MEISASLDGQLHVMNKVVFFLYAFGRQAERQLCLLKQLEKKTQKQSDDNV